MHVGGTVCSEEEPRVQSNSIATVFFLSSAPYILVTRYADIAKLFLDTLQYEVFIREPSGYIKAVDYHYWCINRYNYFKLIDNSYMYT